MVLGCIHACMRPLFPQKTKQKKETNIRWFISPLSSICKKNFTYSYEKEWSGWVKQHALNETFGFLERTLVSEKQKEIKVEKMQTPLEKKGCTENTWLRRFVIWWINTDLLPPMRKNIREWGFDLLLSIKKPGIRKKINMNDAKLLPDMVGQKLVSKERFPITQKTGLCLLLSSNLLLFSLMDTGQGYRIRMFYLRV